MLILMFRIIGSAVYPTFALFNHGCDNNTYKYFLGHKVVVLASKVIWLIHHKPTIYLSFWNFQNIETGEEITENYFPLAQVIPRPERRSWLRDNYRLAINKVFQFIEYFVHSLSVSTACVMPAKLICQHCQTFQKHVSSKWLIWREN